MNPRIGMCSIDLEPWPDRLRIASKATGRIRIVENEGWPARDRSSRGGPWAQNDHETWSSGNSARGSRGMEDRGGGRGGKSEGFLNDPGGRVERVHRQKCDPETPEFHPRWRLRARTRRRGRLVRARRSRARLRPGSMIPVGQGHRSIPFQRVETNARPVARVIATRGLRRPGHEQAERQERQRRSDECPNQPYR